MKYFLKTIIFLLFTAVAIFIFYFIATRYSNLFSWREDSSNSVQLDTTFGTTPEKTLEPGIPETPRDYSLPAFFKDGIKADDIFSPCTNSTSCATEIRNYNEFTDIHNSNWMSDNDRVFLIKTPTNTYGFPLGIMREHELIQIRIENEDLIVYYGPYTASAKAYYAKVNNTPATFSLSGRYYKSSQLIIDSSSKSLWDPFDGALIARNEPIVKNSQLLERDLADVSWKDIKNYHPNTLILSRNTGFNENYTFDNYKEINSSAKIYFSREIQFGKIDPKSFAYGFTFLGKTYLVSERDIPKVGEQREYKSGETQFYINNELGLLKIPNASHVIISRSFLFPWHAHYDHLETLTPVQ